MNASRISFVVCTVALFLVFPSFLLANLIAPNTRDWFSTRSQKKLKERIADLEIRLRFAEDQRTFTPAERGSARAKFVVGLIFGFAGLVILACVILVMGPSGLLVPSHSKLFVLLKITANVGYFATLGFMVHLESTDRRRLEIHSTEGREKLRERIGGLKKLVDKSRQPG